MTKMIVVVPEFSCLELFSGFETIFSSNIWCFYCLTCALMQFPLVFSGCTCFLLFVCHSSSVCGPAGDAASYNPAAKDSRWATNPLWGMFHDSSLPSFSLSPSSVAGGHSWWVHPVEDSPCIHEMKDSLLGAAPGPTPASVTETRVSVAQLSVALGGLRTVFSPLLFRGLFSFFAWWIAACLFSTSLFGLFYHQYLMAA